MDAPAVGLEEFIHTKKLAILIGNSKYSAIGESDLANVQENIELLHSKLKTVFNYTDDDIHVFPDLKRMPLDKEMRKLYDMIDEEHENEGRYLVFLYYGGRCLVVNEK